MPEDNFNSKISYKKPVFIQERSNGQERNSLSEWVKEYSGFVFLVSMKYLKNEKRAEKAAVKILSDFIKENRSFINIKERLYTETKTYFEKNGNIPKGKTRRS